MIKRTLRHTLVTLVLAAAVVGGMLVAYNQVEAQNMQSYVETIEIDLEQQTGPPAAATPIDADTDQTQFMYLIGLATLGVVSIAGVTRDVRRDRA
ncbi:MAG: hypothetical protein Q8P33_01755 [bacterium]|nr:hypothetical protein [bacterium]